MNMKYTFSTFLSLICVISLHAKIDLVTLPKRDSVQVTIYNSADLTLVREVRTITLVKGINRLQLAWANTLIDPTSLDMRALKNDDQIEIELLNYPSRTRQVGVWRIKSEISGSVPFEITYFTSGVSWQSFYMATLSADEKTMELKNFVTVRNFSGEDYNQAQTRVIVGKVNLLDQIAMLARRAYPYGSPVAIREDLALVARAVGSDAAEDKAEEAETLRRYAGKAKVAMTAMRPKEIRKEGLSEYFLYTVEGTEDLPNKWSKRLLAFNATAIPVENLYKYEEERYGRMPCRFLYFKNDKEHKLGTTPLPNGGIQVYRQVDPQQHLSYEGRSSIQYIPVGQKAEVNLGNVRNVVVKPRLMRFRIENITFSWNGRISGYDKVEDWEIEVRNTRSIPVRIEITRNYHTPHWDISQKLPPQVKWEKIDLDTGRYTLTLQPNSTVTIPYTLRRYTGDRARRH